MTDTKEKKMPKGGRKGGTLFPKINLKQALAYAKKLVAKTHTGSQPASTILPGVFGNAGAEGQVRASALKQFGLLQGKPEAYSATQLAKDIDAAPEDEQTPLLQQAFLTSRILKDIFNTFQGDSVSKAKIEQRAKGLKVHPETASECAQIFIESAESARLGTIDGDSITLSPPSRVNAAQNLAEELGENESEPEMPEVEEETARDAATPGSENANHAVDTRRRTAKPELTVNLNVDSSSDPDKLEKQLKLLRTYGVI